MYDTVKILFILSCTVILFVRNSEGIFCYRCSSVREHRISGILPCSEFDWSQKFAVDCSKSTLCLKRTYTIPLLNGQKIHSVERDCAPQKFDGQNYSFAERKWYRTETIVETAYKEGCNMAEDTGRPGQPTEYCFCNSPMCNDSNSFKDISFTLIALNLIVTLLSMWG